MDSSSERESFDATWLSPTLLQAIIPITFGEDTAFGASIDLFAFAHYYDGHSSEWIADAGNSFYWGGIKDVTNAQGEAVSFSITSASGTDYLVSQAPVPESVPEPSTYVLFSMGLLVLVASRRFGARRAQPSPACPA